MNVFLLIPWGVDAKSTLGVFYTYDQAAQAAKEVWEASDGYHAMVIQERKIGVLYDYGLVKADRGWRGKPTTEPLKIDFQPENTAERA